jgi:ankyrin repeat protein
MSRQKETIPSSSILREAVANGEIELVKDLLNEGADLQTQDQVMIDGNLPLWLTHFEWMNTLLHIASYEGHLLVVLLLLNQGIALDSQNKVLFRS